MEEIKDLMWSFTEAMAEAIDARTPYNAHHVRMVADYVGKNIPTSHLESIKVGLSETDGSDFVEIYEKD